MKKLAFVVAIAFAAFFIHAQAQAQKIHNPDAKVTVTADQIKAWGAPADQVASIIVPLTFEGLGNLDEISQFYNGGTSAAGFSGTNYGVSFSNNALAVINIENGGGSGNFTNTEMSHTAMFFLSGNNVTLNIPNGFKDALSLQYILSGTGAVSIYDEIDGNGMLLASLILPATTQESKSIDVDVTFKTWKHLGVSFSGTAKSVIFTGPANQCAFDNVILGSDKMPEPGEAVKATSGKSGDAAKVTFVASGGNDQSPATKGKYLIAGASRLGLNLGVEKQVSGSSDYKTSYYNFDFMPKAGYFVIDNLAVGLFIDFNIYSYKAKDEGMLSDKGTTFTIGPFARYYIPVCDKFVPFVEIQFGGGIDYYKSRYYSTSDWMKSDKGLITFRGGGGATYFFNDNVGADLFLGYLHDSYKYKDTDSGTARSSDSKIKYNEFILQFGIVVILDF
jgi:hypothetical protein